MYVKTRTFWLVNNKTDACKLLLFRKSKSKLPRISFQKSIQYRWKLLKPRSKYTKTVILIATHIKNIHCRSKYGKNIFCGIIGGWYMELKEFCALDWTELPFSNSLFQNNYLNISRSIKLKYTSLNSLFLWPHCLSLYRFCASLWSKNKRKHPLTVTIKKTREILCQTKWI